MLIFLLGKIGAASPRCIVGLELISRGVNSIEEIFSICGYVRQYIIIHLFHRSFTVIQREWILILSYQGVCENGRSCRVIDWKKATCY